MVEPSKQTNNTPSQLQSELSNLQATHEQCTFTLNWLPVFQLFLTSLKNSIDSYNAKANSASQIQYEYTELPCNTFIDAEERCYFSIQFRKDVIWEVLIGPPRQFSNPLSPSFWLHIYSDAPSAEEASMHNRKITEIICIILVPQDDAFLIKIHKKDRFDFSKIHPCQKILENPHTVFEQLAIDLVTIQLQQL